VEHSTSFIVFLTWLNKLKDAIPSEGIARIEDMQCLMQRQFGDTVQCTHLRKK